MDVTATFDRVCIKKPAALTGFGESDTHGSPGCIGNQSAPQESLQINDQIIPFPAQLLEKAPDLCCSLRQRTKIFPPVFVDDPEAVDHRVLL